MCEFIVKYKGFCCGCTHQVSDSQPRFRFCDLTGVTPLSVIQLTARPGIEGHAMFPALNITSELFRALGRHLL